MSVDPTIVVAVVAAAASIATTVITVRDRGKVAETHRQVTVNHHSSESPTVLDVLSDLRGEVRALADKHEDHLKWHLNHRR